MATTITDVDGLQAMEDDTAGDYVLGNNIDASATSGWNDGAGFDPIGTGATQYAYSRPWDDDFGYAGQSGSWIIYPSDGVFYDKVDEETSDGDDTYIQATANNDWALLSPTASDLVIPDDATNIVVRIRARVRNVASGTSYIQGMLNFDGTEYLVGSNLAISSQSYALKTWTIPDYPVIGSGWSPGEVLQLSVAGVGVKVSDATPDIRITQLYIEVEYNLIFTGTFDGGGYTISDLYINRPTEDEIGLFGITNNATIENVTLADCNITGRDDVGVLVGQMEGGTVTNCHSSGVVTGTDDYVGGLIGFSTQNGSSGATISECFSSCTVSGDGFIGGFIGYPYLATISKCYATGDVTGTSGYAGGLIGVSYQCDIDNCYARGDVDGDRYIAGLIGYAYDNTETIDNCYSTGAVTGNSNLGGLIAYSESVVSNCFWDTTTSGQATSDGGTGKTTAQMKAIATFSDAGWDIIVWVERNDGYPYLGWEVDKTSIWLIHSTVTRCFTIPDVWDGKGRPPKGARVRVYRVDTHELIATVYLNRYGSATICGLPNDVDVVFHVTWGGPRGSS